MSENIWHNPMDLKLRLSSTLGYRERYALFQLNLNWIRSTAALRFFFCFLPELTIEYKMELKYSSKLHADMTLNENAL